MDFFLPLSFMYFWKIQEFEVHVLDKKSLNFQFVWQKLFSSKMTILCAILD